MVQKSTQLSDFNQTNTIIADHKKRWADENVDQNRALTAYSVRILLPANASWAGQASVMDATVQANNNGTYAISTTIFYKDEGLEHYVYKFEVLDISEKVLATRVLFHPHAEERPFTRSISNFTVPVDTT